jgi:hypothetical protein
MDRSERVEQALAQVPLRSSSPVEDVHPIVADLRRHTSEGYAEIRGLSTLNGTDQDFEKRLRFFLARVQGLRVLLKEAQAQTQNLSVLSAEMKETQT